MRQGHDERINLQQYTTAQKVTEAIVSGSEDKCKVVGVLTFIKVLNSMKYD
jgi:LDH2 family malate/lactate/ureidoglycolate dehydrogenase